MNAETWNEAINAVDAMLDAESGKYLPGGVMDMKGLFRGLRTKLETLIKPVDEVQPQQPGADETIDGEERIDLRVPEPTETLLNVSIIGEYRPDVVLINGDRFVRAADLPLEQHVIGFMIAHLFAQGVPFESIDWPEIRDLCENRGDDLPTQLTFALKELDAHHRAEINELSVRFRAVNVERVAEQMQVDVRGLAEEKANLIKALTPSAETKAEYIGEFQFTHTESDSDGEPYDVNITVPWTTVKDIMNAIRHYAAVLNEVADKARKQAATQAVCTPDTVENAPAATLTED